MVAQQSPSLSNQLGAAVDWPASLDDPASIALPRLAENEGAVYFGYFAYLLYSVLFAVIIVLDRRRRCGFHTCSGA